MRSRPGLPPGAAHVPGGGDVFGPEETYARVMMSPLNPEPTYQSIYDLIMRRLGEMGCGAVVQEIEVTVRRGIVQAVDQQPSSRYVGVRP